jgi:hypothetical protein
MDDRLQLPYTLTDSGRKTKLKDFGIEGGWAVALPVFMAGFVSVFITIIWLIAGTNLWPVRLVVGMSPLWGALLYVKTFIIGKPPAWRQDVVASWKRYRVDFRSPLHPRLPFLPSMKVNVVTFTRPQDGAVHPLAAAARKLSEDSD